MDLLLSECKQPIYPLIFLSKKFQPDFRNPPPLKFWFRARGIRNSFCRKIDGTARLRRIGRRASCPTNISKKSSSDWNVRYETPAGKACLGGDPAGASRGPTARGKRVPGVEINAQILQALKKKIPPPLKFWFRARGIRNSFCRKIDGTARLRRIGRRASCPTNISKKSSSDWNVRYETPAGKACLGGDPAGASRGPTARGKRVPGVEINAQILQALKKKT